MPCLVNDMDGSELYKRNCSCEETIACNVGPITISLKSSTDTIDVSAYFCDFPIEDDRVSIYTPFEKPKRQYLLTCKVSRYCILAL